MYSTEYELEGILARQSFARPSSTSAKFYLDLILALPSLSSTEYELDRV